MRGYRRPGLDVGSEDPLTFDVWSGLDIGARAVFLRPVVEAIARLNPDALSGPRLESLLAELEQFEFDFWPGHRAVAGFFVDFETGETQSGTVPDVIAISPSWVLVIEAKFGSPLGLPHDQLPREFAIGDALARGGARERELLLVAVTLGFSPPEVPLPSHDRRVPKGTIGAALRAYFEFACRDADDATVAAKAGELARRVDGRWAWIGWPVIAEILRDAVGSVERYLHPPEWETHLRSARRFGTNLLDALAARGIAPFRGFATFDGLPEIAKFAGEKLLSARWRTE